MNKKLWMGMALFGLLAFPAFPQTEQGKDVGPDEYYQSALQSYLNGDIDQAILMDSKALKMDPQNQKAQALLTVLIGEKDTAQKTVIWIGGKPSTVEQAPAVNSAPAPVTVVKEKPVAVGSRMDMGKVKEMENRIQMMAFLLQRDSINQYKELAGAQAENGKRLDQMTSTLKGMGLWNSFLFLLALIIASLALWNSLQTRREMKKQAGHRGRSDDSRDHRVVNIR